MSALLIAGSPSERSRSAALLDAVSQRLHARGALVDRIHIRNLSPQALLLADFGHPTVVAATDQVAKARVLVVATPVYKAAYSGVLKVFLDLLPQTALKGKTVLPLATGGSPHHMLALDYALRPVLQSLGAKHIPARHLRHRFTGHSLARGLLRRAQRRGRAAGRRCEPDHHRDPAARTASGRAL